jgi:hypothetical protein
VINCFTGKNSMPKLGQLGGLDVLDCDRRRGAYDDCFHVRRYYSSLHSTPKWPSILFSTRRLQSMKQSEIDSTETKDISITFPSGPARQFPGQSLLLGAAWRPRSAAPRRA